jgi:AraC family transcriptional regulator
MAHISDEAGLHPEKFARQFRATFGLTPAAYRIMFRLNYASRLCWSRPELSVMDVAEASGFRNKAYFHRAFLAAFRTTPREAKQRFMRSFPRPG